MRRALAIRALDRTGAGAAARRLGRWRGVLVLNYHRVGDWSDGRWDTDLWSASAAQLDEQFGTLARETEVVPVDAIPDAIGAARGRRVAITFDDGYRDNHDVALPLLRAHGLVATFFVATGFVDSPRAPWWDEIAWIVRTSPRGGVPAIGPAREPIAWTSAAERKVASARLIEAGKTLAPEAVGRYLDAIASSADSARCDPGLWSDRWMTWDMIRALRDAGMSIGGHTIDHPVLARLGPDAQRAEIDGCGRRLADELGQPMRYFSYPIGTPGTFDARTLSLVREAGVELAFAYDGGVAGPRDWNPLTVPRASVYAAMGGAAFRALVTAPRAFARW